MAQSNTGSTRTHGGLIDKRRAILSGALTVFARDGYTRAGIDAIAAAAGVSTRTIYNHFDDKAHLFEAVLRDSSTGVAETLLDLINEHLGPVQNAQAVEPALLELGMTWAPHRKEHAEHFALVRQINAESAHLPRLATEAWYRTGPQRVRRELAYHLRRISDLGLLRIGDSDVAAYHFMLLTSATNPLVYTPDLSDEEIRASVRAGVHAFLYGYLPPREVH